MGNFLRAYVLRFLEREPSFLGRQKLLAFIFQALLIDVGCLAYFSGFTAPFHPFYLTLNVLFFALITSFVLAYLFKWVSLRVALSGNTIVATLITASQMLYAALTRSAYSLDILVGYVAMLFMNQAFCLVTYQRVNTYLLGALSTLTYVGCVFISGDKFMRDFLSVFLSMFVLISALGERLIRNAYQVIDENASLRQEEEKLLSYLRMNKEQVMAYIEMVDKKSTPERVGTLFKQLDERTQRQLMRKLKDYTLAQATKAERMATLFPELSPTERSICALILQEKKLSEIAQILDKTENNVNTQRSNIRRKLGLASVDNLLEALQARLPEEDF